VAVSFDVTSDVQVGSSAWLVKTAQENAAGHANYYSREGAAVAAKPELAPRIMIVEVQKVSVSGRLYSDLSGNGSDDGASDPPLVGWTVDLLDSANQLAATTSAGSSGNYSFTSVAPGSYAITEVLASGWVPTQPVN
jgi:hypothetical protein